MTDLNPEIWDNNTLGEAAQNPNLDQITRQEQENRSAKIEGREPRTIVVENTYPGYVPKVNERTGTIPSNYQTAHFEDEQQNDIPENSGPASEDTAAGVSKVDTPEEGNSTEEPASSNETPQQGESTVTPSAEEGNTTQWT